MPKGYIFAEIEVTDPATYEQYRPLAAAAIAAHGGRYLVRGGEPRALEGDRSPKRVVVLEFDSPEQAEAFYRSPQYQEALAIRQRSSKGHLYLLTGAASPSG
ncbi:hypothetical protein GCM10010964_29120 [Caldovatus sediminis]|uniref:DUF1330 domain-containing protein n=1 Tax=Caldovatus sediminis TaxID=2041189 RepID=A0A8J3ED52_9PROT|nr:DUF1330 domain-containing protein [Caldovatus sediminis]GGG39729.1 hypothetical protein GCM10010964_29120 [Caldovatus sediminis]